MKFAQMFQYLSGNAVNLPNGDSVVLITRPQIPKSVRELAREVLPSGTTIVILRYEGSSRNSYSWKEMVEEASTRALKGLSDPRNTAEEFMRTHPEWPRSINFVASDLLLLSCIEIHPRYDLADGRRQAGFMIYEKYDDAQDEHLGDFVFTISS